MLKKILLPIVLAVFFVIHIPVGFAGEQEDLRIAKTTTSADVLYDMAKRITPDGGSRDLIEAILKNEDVVDARMLRVLLAHNKLTSRMDTYIQHR